MIKLLKIPLICLVVLMIFKQIGFAQKTSKLNTTGKKFKIFQDNKLKLSWGEFKNSRLRKIFEEAKSPTDLGFEMLFLNIRPEYKLTNYFEKYCEEYKKSKNEFDKKRNYDNCEGQYQDYMNEIDENLYFYISSEAWFGDYNFEIQSFPLRINNWDTKYEIVNGPQVPRTIYHIKFSDQYIGEYFTSVQMNEKIAEKFVKDYPDKKLSVIYVFEKPKEAYASVGFSADLVGYIVTDKKNNVLYLQHVFDFWNVIYIENEMKRDRTLQEVKTEFIELQTATENIKNGQLPSYESLLTFVSKTRDKIVIDYGGKLVDLLKNELALLKDDYDKKLGFLTPKQMGESIKEINLFSDLYNNLIKQYNELKAQVNDKNSIQTINFGETGVQINFPKEWILQAKENGYVIAKSSQNDITMIISYSEPSNKNRHEIVEGIKSSQNENCHFESQVEYIINDMVTFEIKSKCTTQEAEDFQFICKVIFTSKDYCFVIGIRCPVKDYSSFKVKIDEILETMKQTQ